MISTALSAVPGRYRRRLSLSVRFGTLLLVLGILTMFAGVAIVIGSRGEKPKEAVEMKETPYAYVTIQNNYRIDLLVIDYLATMQEGEKEKEDYYLAMFVDGDKKPYYCVLRADKNTDLYDGLREYLADETQNIGDARYDGYYSVRGMSHVKDLQKEFDEGVEKYDELLSAEVGETSKSIYYLEYICGADEDYNAVVKSKKTMGTLGNYATILIGAVLVVCGILLFVRQKKKNALPDEEQTVYQYPQQPGAPGAGGYPQQPYTAPPQNDSFYQPTTQQPQQPYAPQQPYGTPPSNDPFYQPAAQQPYDPSKQPFEAPQQGGYDPNGTGDPPAGV